MDDVGDTGLVGSEMMAESSSSEAGTINDKKAATVSKAKRVGDEMMAIIIKRLKLPDGSMDWEGLNAIAQRIMKVLNPLLSACPPPFSSLCSLAFSIVCVCACV